MSVFLGAFIGAIVVLAPWWVIFCVLVVVVATLLYKKC